MDAIVFASYVPDSNKMYIIHEMFDVFRQYFTDCDLYVGINGNICPEYTPYLQSQQEHLNLKYATVPKELEIRTDVSAYQAGLKLLKNSGKKYDYVWFGHTKGMINDTSQWRYDFIENFFSKREEITNLLKVSNAGTYSLYLTKYAGVKDFKDVLSQYYNFDKPYFYTYFYLFTFYVFKGKYLHNFLDNCSPDFYNTNLVKNGADVYMFERDFPHIVWRQGGYPLYKEWKGNMTQGGCHPENHYYEDIRQYYV